MSDDNSNLLGFKAVLRIAPRKLFIWLSKIVKIGKGQIAGKNKAARLHKISQCDNPGRVADVIFVHGLDGDAFETWHAKDKPNDFWPKWLGSDLQQVGIWTLGYSVHSSAWTGTTMPLVDRATNVLDLLELEGIGKRPLIFVCHSLGGLLIKQLLRHCYDHANVIFRQIAGQTKAIVFLSTPHLGADLATWVSRGVLIRPSVSIKELEAHNVPLRNLNDWYRNYPEVSKIETLVYYETQAIAGFIIVNEISADPGISGAHIIPVDANHITICKPTSKDNQIYRRVKRTIEKYSASLTPGPILTVAPNTGDTPAKQTLKNEEVIDQSQSVEDLKNEVKQHSQKIASLQKDFQNLTAKTSGNAFGTTTETNSNATTTASLTAENVLAGDSKNSEPKPPVISTNDNSTVDGGKSEQDAVFSSTDGSEVINVTLEEQASEWINRLEDYLEVDQPKAFEVSNTIQTWIEANLTQITKVQSAKLYRLLFRIEFVKFSQNHRDADLAKAKRFLEKGKI